MTTTDFQSILPGKALAFPYDCAPQCRIISISPIGPGPSGGSISESGNGFVGLAAGTRLEIQFSPSTSAVSFRLHCSATPSRLEIYSSTGTLLGNRSLIKGPLGVGAIAFAANDIARGVLLHDNGEGLLLAVQWDGDGDTELKRKQRDEPEDGVMRAAGVVFALTGALRATAERTADLNRAREAIAAAVMRGVGEFATGRIITPTAEDLELGTVRSVWHDCMAAATRASQIKRAEVAMRTSEENEGLSTAGALGPFEDMSPGGRKSIYVFIEPIDSA